MPRYTRDDIARLGPSAQRQIAGLAFAEAEQARQQGLAERSRNKYGARRTNVDGYWFDSDAEARRFVELKRLGRAGLLTSLVRQPRFDITVAGVYIGYYRADFMYYNAAGDKVIEDVKSKATITAVYRIKKKLVQALHNVTITEVMT